MTGLRYRRLFALYLVAACGFAQGAGSVFAYEGVLAPPSADSTAGQPSGGYDGVLAPSAPSQQPSAPERGDAGNVLSYTPMETAPQMSVPPGEERRLEPKTPKTSDDLKALSFIHAHDKDGDKIPDALKGSIPDMSSAAAALSRPKQRVDGMLPAELRIKKTIDTLFRNIKESKTPEERKKNLDLADESLRSLQKGLRVKRRIPDTIYKSMNLPDTYIKEEQEGTDKALARLGKALEDLSRHQ